MTKPYRAARTKPQVRLFFPLPAKNPPAAVVFSLYIFILAIPYLHTQEAVYPRIESMEVRARDVVFRQFQDDVEEGRRLVFNRRRKETDEELAARLVIYSYIPGPDDTLMGIAARCSLPYSSIATLNNLTGPGGISGSGGIAGRPLLLPSLPGLFIHEDGGSDFERLLLASREGDGVAINLAADGGSRAVRFVPGGDLSPTERALFLNPGLFRFPLRTYTITSRFGSRISPMSGVRSAHKGMDMAAPHGTEVYAVREGTVTFCGENDIYGNYVIITHDGGWSSLYGHLSRIETTLNKKVQSGSLVGRVGSTGLSTGPHLHFELRQNGTPQDPAPMLKGR
jgi:murein DD-endopeptidase MepM/ murein hydrolase activator NlpD